MKNEAIKEAYDDAETLTDFGNLIAVIPNIKLLTIKQSLEQVQTLTGLNVKQKCFLKQIQSYLHYNI